MVPIRLETIKEKISRLKEISDFIKDILKKTDKEIISDNAVYYGLQHMMQISIEIILDVGGHILVENFKVSPKDYKDIIIKLGENGVIDKDFAFLQEKMASFRNILVHDYDKVDEMQVISYAREAPDIFVRFGEAFLKSIKQ